MKPLFCNDSACLGLVDDPDGGSLIRHGSFFRSSDRTHLQRYRCPVCLRTVSRAKLSPEHRQKKRHLNPAIYQLLCSGVSQRRIALLLQLSRTTVARRLVFLAVQKREEQRAERERQIRESVRFKHALFDEMETFERSKCLPLSIALAVTSSRRILGFEVAEMPASGMLAKRSRLKYGSRKDERGRAVRALLTRIAPVLSPTAEVRSDECPRYPGAMRRILPGAAHLRFKGRKPASNGLGELKVGGFDPLFSLNHTCAMVRANLSRLMRRTWCTTKKKQALIDHLTLYVSFHNEQLLGQAG